MSNYRDNRGEFFNRFMFGERFEQRKPHHSNVETIEQLLERLNVEELIDDIDFLMHTARQLKPYVDKVSPIIKQFINK